MMRTTKHQIGAVRGLKPMRSAYSIIEVMVALSILLIMFVSLYSGISAGFAVVQLARENLRATQILQEKMETIRLYTWTQISTPGFIPSTFIEPFYSAGTNIDGGGLYYTGRVQIASSGLTETYAGDLKNVKITLNWTSAGVDRTREMSTYVTRNGLQDYIY